MPDAVETQPVVEEEELNATAPEADLAVAESLLAALLVRFWRDRQRHTPESCRESGAGDITSDTVKA